MTSDIPGLTVAQGGSVLRIQLNRPDKRNAIDDTMVAGLINTIVEAGTDESVRVILLDGAGDHFCSGADIVKRNGGDGKRPRAGSIQRRLPAQAHRLIPVMLESQTPIVCAVRGWAAGIGMGLALAADVTVVADDARFWAPYCSRGFTPDAGVSWLLPRRIGEMRARRMLILGEQIDGHRAAEWGLIERSVPSDAVTSEAEKVAGELAAGPTVALGLTKWLLHSGQSAPFDAHLRNEAFAMELSSRSEDFREGLSAFSNKRRAEFTGR
ncbi:enoyl-CoA hydratase-related protein [Rhodococcus sp. IEGM 1366]|uniref:enoyl-CoA hydratase/isomerase family protein n=1 Tax=Rhodococcus sp. IEGM 1366 TaxID=3082223 RepID=UPI0029546258|nr:enoyl-CoA hydratase-related protein [Rhodococcus sp. IEGM 1366]MDV8071023.1 enoyl-CoA hydratase-related protein [Rhodococcus sp. IEGM 1366]